MNRSFEDFNKAFSKNVIMFERDRWLYTGSTPEERDGYKRWPHHVQSWKRKQVIYAVSEHPTHRDWQKFRVAMKGTTTSQKLYMLDNWLASRAQEGDPDWETEIIRVDNYIGALVRGGLLSPSPKYEVIR